MTGRRAGWVALALAASVAGAWLRLHDVASQIVIDDEWHALHKLMRSGVADILTHLDYADYSIPMTLYFRALYGTTGLGEWGMRAPMLAAGIALVAIAPWLARAWTTLPVRVTWSALLAVSPILVFMSRNARPYAVTTLLATVALVAFERWWRGAAHRRAWAAAYVVAVVMAGWLHMTSLAFTLTPLLYAAALARADGVAWRRLVKLGFATATPLAIVLLPPVVIDWMRFTAKAGVDSVTPDSAYRTLLLLTGTPHLAVAAAFAACAAAGVAVWWRRDRVLAGYVVSVAIVGGLAIVAARPTWVQQPIVFARYVLPVLPVLLLLVAEGFVAMIPRRAALATALAAAALLVVAGPLPAQWRSPNQFTSHARFQFDYDDARNPHVTGRAGDSVPAFYRELARAPAGSLTLVVAPWRLESHFNPHVWYQEVHRQNVRIGLTTPLCGARDFGEYPEREPGMRLSNFVHLDALLRGDRVDADFLVIQRKPWSVPRGQDVPWPDVDACLPKIEAALGAPVYRDDDIVAFALRK